MIRVREEACGVKQGDKFERLEVIGCPFSNGKGRWWAVCLCECGNVIVSDVQNLKKPNHTTSCGCRHKEITRSQKPNLKHGKTDHPLYSVWIGMRRRCTDEKDQEHFRRYGGRGISVCDEWQDFEAFYQWAIANGCKPGLTIDRRDNDGNYEPGNCRWATDVEQSRNISTNVLIAAFGETKCVSAWVEDERCVVKHHTLLGRVHANKMTAEQCITQPSRNRR